LLEERIRLREIDAYGNEDYKKWIGNPPLDEKAIEKNIINGAKGFKEGIPYFWEKVILKKFGSMELFFEKWRSYCNENPTIDDEIVGTIRKLETEDWFAFIASQIEKSCLNLIEKNYSKTINESYKKGIKFENHCMEILKEHGWEVKETPNTGDQGVDLIASINDLRICIQCKDHEKAIGNKAVQEISAGKLFWKGTHAIIVSKSGFTKSAHKLAKSNKVELINEYQLKDLEKFIPLIKNIKEDRRIVIAPPFTAISTFSDHSDFDYLDISSQNIHWEDQGAFTAEISPKMLLEHGVSYAIVGHSEPRKYFSESDEQINKRAVFAQSSGLTPIVCVGETLEQRERGEADRVITRQVEQGLENTDPSNLIVAYEPIWAIGTGKTCEAEDANKICSLIRKLIGFDDVIIQYGGSVKPNNIDEIMSMSDIDGELVGGASLDPNSFARIANYQ